MFLDSPQMIFGGVSDSSGRILKRMFIDQRMEFYMLIVQFFCAFAAHVLWSFGDLIKTFEYEVYDQHWGDWARCQESSPNTALQY